MNTDHTLECAPTLTAKPQIQSRLPGILLATIIALGAWQLGHWFPLVGGPVFGIILGVAVGHIVRPPEQCMPGIRFAGTQVLQWSIVALGFGLSLQQVAQAGLASLSVTLVTITVAFVTAWGLGRLLHIPGKLKVLIGIGTAICGGSAIAAATPIIEADEHDTAFAISTIFLFNLVAVLVFPLLGHLMGMSDHGFGLWAGTAINDTSSVVAAGFSFSPEAGNYATIVKLTRATLIIPVCLGLVGITLWQRKRAHKTQGPHANASNIKLRHIFPWFILWFVIACAVTSLGWIPHAWQGNIHALATFLIIVALAAIGLSADMKRMLATGLRPIALGLGVWIAVAGASVWVQWLGGQLH